MNFIDQKSKHYSSKDNRMHTFQRVFSFNGAIDVLKSHSQSKGNTQNTSNSAARRAKWDLNR